MIVCMLDLHSKEGRSRFYILCLKISLGYFSRPNTFYQNMNNMQAVLVTQKPKYYHPNDGRFVNFSPNSQKLDLNIHSENGNFKSKPVKAINERNFEVINTHSPSNVQTISTKMEETEKRELEVINRGTQSSSIPSREQFKENTIYGMSQKLPKAQNRNMKIDGEDLEDGYNQNNDKMAHQNTRYQNYQISSRSTNIEQQNEERSTSLFSTFQNFLTGVGKAANQVFG